MRHLQQIFIEHRRAFYSIFVNFTKAFDTVYKTILLTFLDKFECPPQFVNMLMLLYRDMKVSVNFKSLLSEATSIDNRV